MKHQLSESNLHIWRACAAIIHIDKKVTCGERDWFKKKIQALEVSPDTKNILLHDLQHGCELEEILSKINHDDMFFFLNLIKELANIDGEVSPEEQEAWDQVYLLVEKAAAEKLTKILHSNDTPMEIQFVAKNPHFNDGKNVKLVEGLIDYLSEV